MRLFRLSILTCLVFLSACASIPKETILLSQALGEDLILLHVSHRNSIEIYYSKIYSDINSFIDEVYVPFIIHYVLKNELEAYNRDEASLYRSIEIAGKVEGKEEAEKALKEMTDFQYAAHKQIEKKRKELLTPIKAQEKEILSSIDQAYKNAIYANSTITGYLKSIKKVKEAQQEALKFIGLSNSDFITSQALIELSAKISSAVETGKEIDIKSDDALKQIDEITSQIKEITKKN